MTESADVLVVGAGMVGAACAREFSRVGAKVAVLERQQPGGGVSAAGMGHLLILDDSPAQLELTRFSRNVWLEEEWPAEVEFDRCGTLWLAARPEEWEAAVAKKATLESWSIRAELLDEKALYGAEPHLASGFLGALRILDDAVVYPAAAVHALLAEARDLGAKIRCNVDVREVFDGGLCCADGTRWVGEHVVVCAGLESLRMAAPDHSEWIYAKKGHLAITDRFSRVCRHELIELDYLASAHGSDARSVASNLLPRQTGQILIGSSRQHEVETGEVEADLLGAMLERACRLYPPLETVPIVRCWTGLRPCTRDHLPILDRLPGRERCWVAAGHEGHGITTSLGSGKLMAALVAGDRPPIDPRPFRFDRLSTREIPR